MLSLYIHIPFCRHKCSYCSFFVTPENEANPDAITSLKERYGEELLREISRYAEQYQGVPLRTVYLGGGTPFQIGKENLYKIIDTILEKRDCEHLEELSIELNPDPFDEVLAFVKEAGKKYEKLYRLRFSFGLQSFDDSVLKESKRNYTFDDVAEFLRQLRLIKASHVVFNGDFIAFGTTTTDKDGKYTLRSPEKQEFFRKVVHSHLFDGFSVYTLELTQGSDRFNDMHNPAKQTNQRGDDDAIIEEFHTMMHIIRSGGYRRYELSNFAMPSRRSIHNTVYRTMESYLWLGINASSFIRPALYTDAVINKLHLQKNDLTDAHGIRFQNTHQRKSYLQGEWVDPEKTTMLDKDTFDIEKLFLSLRTDTGVKHLSTYQHLLVNNRKDLLAERVQDELVTYENDVLKVTDLWYDVYNHLVTTLLETI